MTRRDRLAHTSDKMVKEELKIVKWVQLMRCTDYALKRIFTEEEWKEMVKESKYKTIGFDKDDKEVIILD